MVFSVFFLRKNVHEIRHVILEELQKLDQDHEIHREIKSTPMTTHQSSRNVDHMTRNVTTVPKCIR